MTANQDDEPVAYLGGQAAPAAETPPPTKTAKAPANKGSKKIMKPAAAPQEEEVAGYLGGEEEVPALPPVQEYQASDFIGEQPPEEPPAPDYGAPVEAPPPEEDAAAYDQYGAAPEEAPAETVAEPPPAPEQDPSYFDQYGPETQQGYDAPPAEEAPPEEPAVESSGEFSEPELPKTITQQDAENIIKRITTKKILPPEVAEKEGPRVVPSQELTPRTQPGLKTFPIILGLLFVLYGTALVFRESIVAGMSDGPAKEWIKAILFVSSQQAPPPPPPTVVENEADIRKKAFERMVVESEKRALGLSLTDEKDPKEPGKDPGTPPPAPAPAPSPAPPGGVKKQD